MSEKLFDIQNFEKDKNYCIEASAGTGKTYTIKKIVARLVQENVPLSKILLVTYTEKAAGELRDRIRAELQELQKFQEQKLTVALSEVDDAPIGTIHSFCQKTLRDFAYEANVPFAMNMVGSDTAGELVDRLIRDCWAEKITESGLPVENIRTLMVSALEKYDGKMKFSCIPAATFEEWIHSNPEFEGNLNVLQKNLDKTYKAGGKKELCSVEELVSKILENKYSDALFKSYGTEFDSTKNSGLDSELSAALQYFYDQRGNKTLVQVDPKINFVLTHLGPTYDEFKKRKEEESLQSFDDMISAVRDAVCSERETVTPLCKKLRETYEYAIIDEFQDTNQKQWDIFKTVFLDSPKNHIIVVGDPKQSIYSFQGADLNVYFEARKSIAEKDGVLETLGTNFRSTEKMVAACSELFGKSARNGESEEKDFFENGFFRFMSSEAVTGDGKILPPRLNGKEIPPVRMLMNAGDEAFAEYAIRQIVEFTKVDSNGKTALQVYDKDKKELVNLEFSKIAVLARTRSEMERIEEKMAQVGIPFARYKDANLFSGREANQWLALLRAISVPDFAGRNRKVLNAALISDFFQVPLKDVESADYEDPQNETVQKFETWRALLSKRRYAELLESIYAQTGINTRLYETSRLQQMAKINQIGSYIFDYFYNNRVSAEEVIRHIEGLSIATEDVDDEDGNLVSRGCDFSAVQVMTIHASKGLQFPVVISVAGFKNHNNKVNGPFIYRDGNEKKFGLDDAAKDLRKKEELEEWRRLFYVDYTRAESVLILPFYEKWGEEFKNGNNKSDCAFLKPAHERLTEIQKDLPENLSAWNPKELKKSVQETLSKTTAVACENSEAQDKAIKDFNKGLNAKCIFQHSYSTLSGKLDKNEYSVDGKNLESAEESSAAQEKQKMNEIDVNPVRILGDAESETVGENCLPDVKDYPKGSSLGNALHQTFEKMDFGRIGNLSEDDAVKDAEFQKLIEEQFRSQAFPIGDHPDWTRQTAHFVWHTMNATLPEIHGGKETGESFRLKEIPEEDRLAEMEFQMMNAMEEDKAQNFFKGFIDLIFKRGDYYSVLDWKSDAISNYGIKDETGSGTMQKVDDDYAVQRVLYSYFLIQWLKAFDKFSKMSEEEIFERHFGGVYYVFARGCRAGETSGLYAQTWKSFAELKKSFEQVKKLMVKSKKEDPENG